MTPDLEIDARDLRCPLPVLRLQKALRELRPGQTVRLTATDPMARIDVPHFCTETGQIMLETTQTDTGTTFVIEKVRPPP